MINPILQSMMYLLDAEIDENGDIICLLCGAPNECCKCELDEISTEEDN